MRGRLREAVTMSRALYRGNASPLLEATGTSSFRVICLGNKLGYWYFSGSLPEAVFESSAWVTGISSAVYDEPFPPRLRWEGGLRAVWCRKGHL
jgi:hypothetical protein